MANLDQPAEEFAVQAVLPRAALAPRPHRRASALDLIISWLLRVGVYSSVTVVIIGLVMLVFQDHAALNRSYGGGIEQVLRDGLPGEPPVIHAYPDVIHSIARGEAYGVITLGLLILLVTPVLRVAISIVAFAIERDRLYVVITSVVLLLLLIGIVLGRAGG